MEIDLGNIFRRRDAVSRSLTAENPRGEKGRGGMAVFREDLRVTMQALGWRSDGRYLPLQDDIASVAYWYQTLPHAPFPALPGRDQREII